MSRRLKKEPGLRRQVLALLSWLLVFLFSVAVLAGCSGSPGASPALQKNTASITKTADTKNVANNQQDPEQQPQTNNQAAGQVKLIPVAVTEVADGDTLHVKIGGREEKVRLIGVNAPEIAHPDLGIKEEPYGKEAAAYTKKRLDGKKVYLEFDVGERDKYGRLLAYVWLEKPANDSEVEVRAKMYNVELLLNGYAEVMTVPPNVKYADLFTKLQREAREAGKGLWGAAEVPTSPEKGGAAAAPHGSRR